MCVAVECIAQLGYGKRQHFLVGLLQMGLHLRGVRLNDRPRLYHEVVDIGKIAVAGNGKHIRVAEMTADDHRPCFVVFKMFDLFANHLRLFEIHFFCQVPHLFSKLLH